MNELDVETVAKGLGVFSSALLVGSALLYRSYRRVVGDKADDRAAALRERSDSDKAATDEAANAMQRRTMALVEESVNQWKAHADEMRALAKEAQGQARRDRRLRQIAEARLARVQQQAANDREADRREVERLTRRVIDLEATLGGRRESDRNASENT